MTLIGRLGYLSSAHTDTKLDNCQTTHKKIRPNRLIVSFPVSSLDVESDEILGTLGPIQGEAGGRENSARRVERVRFGIF